MKVEIVLWAFLLISSHLMIFSNSQDGPTYPSRSIIKLNHPSKGAGMTIRSPFNRSTIAAQLLRGCSLESMADHLALAQMLRSGLPASDILESPECERWPETFVWLAEMFQIDLPKGLTPESVNYALDGSREQRITQLKQILTALDGWDTEEAEDLSGAAQEALNELEG